MFTDILSRFTEPVRCRVCVACGREDERTRTGMMFCEKHAAPMLAPEDAPHEWEAFWSNSNEW